MALCAQDESGNLGGERLWPRDEIFFEPIEKSKFLICIEFIFVY